MNYDALFVNPLGRTSRGDFVPALIIVVAAIAFFYFYVTGRTAHFCMLVLLYPAYVLLARRLKDMGQSAWLTIIPLVLMLATFASLLGYVNLSDSVSGLLPWIAMSVSGAFALWACLGPRK